jgi:hypothetical protein
LFFSRYFVRAKEEQGEEAGEMDAVLDSYEQEESELHNREKKD